MSDTVPPTEPEPTPEPPTRPTPAPLPVAGGKPKVEAAYFVLGFIAPVALSGLFGALAWGASAAMMGLDDSGNLGGIVGLVLTALQLVIVVGGALYLFIRGNRTGDARMRSIGLGALWSIAAWTLLMLLLFGSCFVLLGTAGFGG